MSKSFFQDLKTFDRTHDANVANHYANILMCLDKNMMYNLDAETRVPRRVFQMQLDAGEIGQYSTNPDHPVYGDLHGYQRGVGREIIKFGQDLDILVSGLRHTLETDEDLLHDFAQELNFIHPHLLQALRVHPNLKHIMTQRELWEEVLRFSQVTEGQQPRIPTHLQIDRFYMTSVLPSDDSYYEVIAKDTLDASLEGLVLLIASEQEIGKDTIVKLERNRKVFTYSIKLDRKFGYEITSIE